MADAEIAILECGVEIRVLKVLEDQLVSKK